MKLASPLCALAALTVLTPLGAADAQYPAVDERIIQVSARQVTGFGFSRGIDRPGNMMGTAPPDDGHNGFVMDSGIRGDVLWGLPGDEHFRYGPAFDFRSAGYKTAEFGLGGTLLFPFRRGYPLQITPAVGYAVRSAEYGGNGLYLSNTLAWGYRPYNYFHRYGYGIMAFASHRMHLDDPSAYEMTFGIEFDLELAIWTPILMIRMACQNDDPDEPVEDEADPTVRDVGGSSTGAETPRPATTAAP